MTGPDAITPAVEVISALESSDPDAALAALVGCDVDSEGWSSVHPRTGRPGPASVAELRAIRRELEQAKERLTEPASA